MRRTAAAILLFLTLGARAAAPACGVHSDFLNRSDPTLAPVRPIDCSTITQSPPEFTWPPQDGSNTYQLILNFPGGRAESRTTTKNWLLWDQALPAGIYTWQVKVTGKNKDQSETRKFTIADNPVPFVVGGGGAILARAKETPRPRTWSKDLANPIPALKAERADGFRMMLKEVDDDMTRSPQADPKSESKNSNYDDSVTEQKRALAAALAWAGTHDRKYGEEAARRLMAQALWSPSGATGYSANDMANRNVAWTLALGYDWTSDYLSEQQKAAIRAGIRTRTQAMYADILPKLTQYPYDSHGNLTLNIVAAIGALMAGEIPEADDWVKEALPAAVAWTSPWGWQDGGFANGTAQMFWDTGSNLVAWYVFRGAAGVDMAKKEWVRNHARFMAYFVPPGTPSNNFGDGQELNLEEVWSRIGKAFALFAPSPVSRWYARQMNKEDPARLELLLAPRVDPGAGNFPTDLPNSAAFPSVGWVAMHSSLADPDRASIYFKSSPYGSYNHSHSDQLGFVVNHRGRRLAIASGYYDDYGTRHWMHWYKQTRAANAITFDGGFGQGHHDKRFSGEITRFESNDTFDFAVGRAEKAYDGALTRAQRSIVYLRPNVVLVHDVVASAKPHTWEWNIHALNKITKISETRIAIKNGPAQMCVEMLSAPDVAFNQTDQFNFPPQSAKMPNQWHGVFATTAKSASAEFLVLMRIGSDCTGKAAPTSVKKQGNAWQVEVDGKSVTLQD